MKAIVLCYRDADPGVDANNIILRANVLFCGSDVPGFAILDQGPQENGVPIPLALTGMTAASYSNAVEAALVSRAAAIPGLPVLANTDVLLPTYTRGT